MKLNYEQFLKALDACLSIRVTEITFDGKTMKVLTEDTGRPTAGDPVTKWMGDNGQT